MPNMDVEFSKRINLWEISLRNAYKPMRKGNNFLTRGENVLPINLMIQRWNYKWICSWREFSRLLLWLCLFCLKVNKNFILSLNIGTVRTMVRTFNSRKIMTWIQRRIFIFSFGGVNKYMGGGGVLLLALAGAWG